MTSDSEHSPPLLVVESGRTLSLTYIYIHIENFVSLSPLPRVLPILGILFYLGAGDDQMNRIDSDNQGPPRPSVSLTNFIVVRMEYYL